MLHVAEQCIDGKSATAKTRKLEILLLCDKPKAIAATLYHHIDALSTLSRHRVTVVAMFGDLPRRPRKTRRAPKALSHQPTRRLKADY